MARAESDPAPTEPTDVIAALEQQLGAMFATVRTLVKDRAAQVHPDLAAAGYTVLATLVRSGPRHAVSLAESLYLDKSAISRIVKQLTDLGLVERRPDPDDGRAFFLAATPDAVRRVGEVQVEHRRRLYEFLGTWPEGDIRQLTALLKRLNGGG